MTYWYLKFLPCQGVLLQKYQAITDRGAISRTERGQGRGEIYDFHFQ